MIIISDDLVLGLSEETNPNSPLIGWHNLVTVDNVVASSEDADYPIVNVANPITSPIAKWKAANDDAQTITIEVNSIEEIDYVGVARHNLGSQQIPITIEGSDGGGSPDWHELVQEVLLPDDSPVIFRYTPQSLTHVRLSMGVGGVSGADPAEIAVIYVGKLLPMQRRIYVGHTPIPYGRVSRIVNGKTEGGDFLGRIVLSEFTGTSVEMLNLTPAWYRSTLDPFIKAAKDTPFFFAWRPGDYPDEVGFCWITNDPRPVNQLSNGMMSIDFQLNGIAP